MRYLKGASRGVSSIGVLIGLLGEPSASLAQGTYERPFAANSIWNLPIAKGAKYAPAGFVADLLEGFSDAAEGINRFKASDAIIKVYRKINPLRPACDSSNVDKGVLLATMRTPDSFLWRDNLTDGGRTAFVMPDDSGTHVVNSTTKQLVEGDVLEFMGFERCTIGGDAAATWKSSLPHSLYGNGYPTKGMHGGSWLSVLGGEIRSGELVSSPQSEIPHAIKLSLPASETYYYPLDSTPGYVWPAKRADGYAATNYSGTNPLNELGRLYAIHPTFGCSSLKTEPGRKICRAVQKYGAYAVDTTTKEIFKVRFQIINPTNYLVRQELKDKYGIDTTFIPKDTRYKNQATKDFKWDIDTVYQNLMAVSNTSSEYPKGPPS